MDIDIDEGKPFYVSRIEFQGNTITRDRVIRRELMLDEGSVYNSQLWEYSLLRLNQLEYFEPLKVDQDSEAHQDPGQRHRRAAAQGEGKGQELDRHERRRQRPVGRIPRRQLPDQQLPRPGRNAQPAGATWATSAASSPSASRSPTSSNRPIQARLPDLTTTSRTTTPPRTTRPPPASSANLTAAEQSLTQNYNQAADGLELLRQLSAQAARLPARRLHLFAGASRSITAFSTASQTFFQTISFRSGIQGSNALAGIINSQVSFTYSYNTINNPVRPRTGKEYTAAFQAAGIWGNVRYISPLVAYKRFIPMHYLIPSDNGRNVLGIRAQLGYVQGFGGDVAPPNNRFYAGGEDELRGFDVRGATPYGYVPSRVNFQLTNPDGSCVPRDPTNPQDNQCIQVPLPVYGVASIGGDTNLTTNVEYRIPDRRPVDVLVLRRLWHRRGHQSRPVEAEPRGLCLADRAALRLPGLQQRLLPGRHSGLEGRIPAEHPAHLRHQLCAAHVAGRRAVGHHAHHQRALPPLLRLQPAAPLRDALLQRRASRRQAGKLLGAS